MAGHKTWAVLEEMLQTEFQGYIADQIVAVFTNNTARDAQWPSPPNGAVCRSAGALQTYFTGTGWYRAENLLGYQARTTTAGPATTEATVSGLSVTATLPANRLIRVALEYHDVHCGTPSTTATIRLKDNGATIMETSHLTDASGNANGGVTSRTYAASSGSRTWTVTLEGTGGSAFITAASTYPTTITVTDVGGA